MEEITIKVPVVVQVAEQVLVDGVMTTRIVERTDMQSRVIMRPVPCMDQTVEESVQVPREVEV